MFAGFDLVPVPDKTLYECIAEDLDPDEHSMHAWLALLRCFSDVERALMRHFAQKFNSSLPRYDVLTALALFRDGLTMGELAHKLMVTKGNITGVIRRLTHDQLVRKITSKSDRRIQRVTITPDGRKLWIKMQCDYETIVGTMMSELPDKQADSLVRTLERARVAIERAASKT